MNQKNHKPYSLEDLIILFEKHHEEFMEYERKRLRDSGVFLDTFSISKALKVICEEIKLLKKGKLDQ